MGIRYCIKNVCIELCGIEKMTEALPTCSMHAAESFLSPFHQTHGLGSRHASCVKETRLFNASLKVAVCPSHVLF